MSNDEVLDKIHGIVGELLNMAPSDSEDLTPEKYAQMRNKAEELNSLKNSLGEG